MKDDARMAGATVHVLYDAEQARRESAEQWLLRSAEDEQTALTEWSDGPAVLVAGRGWDAVRVPYNLLDAGFDGYTEPAVLRACVERLRLVGPVFCDPYRPYAYFLVPVGTDRRWPHDEFRHTEVECLGGTAPYIHYVVVPRVDRAQRPGLFWLVSPDSVAFRHVDAEHLRTLLSERVSQVQAASRAVR